MLQPVAEAICHINPKGLCEPSYLVFNSPPFRGSDAASSGSSSLQI